MYFESTGVTGLGMEGYGASGWTIGETVGGGSTLGSGAMGEDEGLENGKLVC